MRSRDYGGVGYWGFSVLMSVLDLANHDPGAKVAWEADAEGCDLITHEGFEGGMEIFDDYGPKANDELIMGYGFSIEGNKDDRMGAVCIDGM